MHYWNSVVEEVLHKNDSSHAFLYTNNGLLHDECYFNTAENDYCMMDERETRDLRNYFLGEKYPGVYITKREAESVFWIIQGLTIPQTACKLGLSSRTVEFYVKNLKVKLKCINKKELLEKILETDLLMQLEKEGLKVFRH
ncbi:MAG: LuxR C-terminal-related transcriptional regulator [Gammaproteobacteria bacterium]|nr:LuxR C-terminal-related transcriptional regulator [Gammaproteobacteria bacterium]